MGFNPTYEELLRELDLLKKEIDEHKKAKQIYQRVLESASEGFMLLDSNRLITDVNAAILKISGYHRDEFIGHRVDEFYEKATINFNSASHNHLSFEALFRSKTDQMIPMLFNRSVLKDDSGNLTGYMYFLTDFTELRAAQEEQKKAEQQYRNMYEYALQGMFQSRPSGALIIVNPSYARILGYRSPEEILALTEGALKFYFDPEDRVKMIRAVQRKGSLTNYELRLKRKDGKPVWILVNIRLTKDDKGDPILEGIMVDNTKKSSLKKSLNAERKNFENLPCMII